MKKFSRKGKHARRDDDNALDTAQAAPGQPAGAGEDDDPFFFGAEEATGEQSAVSAQEKQRGGSSVIVGGERGGVDKRPAPANPMANSGLLIDMRGVVKTYNEGEPSELTVLHGIDFHAKSSEFVSIVGPSGCGKSTLMNLIGMLDRPSKGAYAFNGEPVYAKEDKELASYRSKNIGFIFQNFNLIGRIDALQNVAMPMMYAGVERKEREERAAELLEMMGMGDRIHHNPNELSGGQKQRVAIARSLANDPDLLLADEPTGALDSKTGRMVMDLFHKLHKDLGKSVVFITHNPELAEETERVVEMMDGRVANVRTPAGLGM